MYRCTIIHHFLYVSADCIIMNRYIFHKLIGILFFILCTPLTAQNKDLPSIKHNSWSLIIYRPENNYEMNDVRCWLKAEDAETGEDVTYSKIKAKYEWVANSTKFQKNPKSLSDIFIPDFNSQLYEYKRTYFLSGGMAMHLNLQKGKYKFTVYTPKDKTNLFETPNKEDWISNEFYYNTENPAKVIWVIPTANDNGFYTGGWYIDYHAPTWYKFTKPKIQ